MVIAGILAANVIGALILQNYVIDNDITYCIDSLNKILQVIICTNIGRKILGEPLGSLLTEKGKSEEMEDP